MFDVVSCAYQMVKPREQDAVLLTKEELVVPKKLLEREMNFTYDILHQSGEIMAKIIVGDSADYQTFIFTEYQNSTL